MEVTQKKEFRKEFRANSGDTIHNSASNTGFLLSAPAADYGQSTAQPAGFARTNEIR